MLWMQSKEGWNCDSCREENLCEERNCNGNTNPDFFMPIRISDHSYEVVKACPITFLPEDYNVNTIYVSIGREFGFTPDQIDEIPISVIDFFLAIFRSESWRIKDEQIEMDRMRSSVKSNRKSY